MIQKRLPQLRWADYPRSITSAAPPVAAAIRRLIERRRDKGIADLDVKVVEQAGIDELRALAFLNARPSTDASRHGQLSASIARCHLYVLCRADGYCEGCEREAPFVRAKGDPYLEPHHTTRLADGGADDPREVIVLCPNCHSRVHLPWIASRSIEH